MNRISLWSFTAVFLLMTVAVQAHPSAKPSARIRSQQVTPDQGSNRPFLRTLVTLS